MLVRLNFPLLVKCIFFLEFSNALRSLSPSICGDIQCDDGFFCGQVLSECGELIPQCLPNDDGTTTPKPFDHIDCSNVDCGEGSYCAMPRPTCGSLPLPLCYKEAKPGDPGEMDCSLVHCNQGYHCDLIQNPKCGSLNMIHQCLPGDQTPGEINCGYVKCNEANNEICGMAKPSCYDGTLPLCFLTQPPGPGDLNCSMLRCPRGSHCAEVQTLPCLPNRVFKCLPDAPETTTLPISTDGDSLAEPSICDDVECEEGFFCGEVLSECGDLVPQCLASERTTPKPFEQIDCSNVDCGSDSYCKMISKSTCATPLLLLLCFSKANPGEPGELDCSIVHCGKGYHCDLFDHPRCRIPTLTPECLPGDQIPGEINCGYVKCDENEVCGMAKPTCYHSTLPLCFGTGPGDLNCSKLRCPKGSHCEEVQTLPCLPNRVFKCLPDVLETTIRSVSGDIWTEQLRCTDITCRNGYTCRETKPTCGSLRNPLCWPNQGQSGSSELSCSLIHCAQGRHCARIQNPTCGGPDLIYQCVAN